MVIPACVRISAMRRPVAAISIVGIIKHSNLSIIDQQKPLTQYEQAVSSVYALQIGVQEPMTGSYLRSCVHIGLLILAQENWLSKLWRLREHSSNEYELFNTMLRISFPFGAVSALLLIPIILYYMFFFL